MFEEDPTYIHNLPKVEKMELFSEVTFYTYRTKFLFSLVAASGGDVLAMGNPKKEMDI